MTHASPELDALLMGYRRFRANGWEQQRERWASLCEGQHPRVMIIACSDSRHYSAICRDVYKFSAMQLSKEQRDMIHNDNERIPLATIGKTVEFYLRIVQTL